MITGEQFVQLALSFPGTEQVPHFERIGFKVTGKRMFCTYLDKDNTANIFLTPRSSLPITKYFREFLIVNFSKNKPCTDPQ
jgi:hypothetical protein